jgi:predicted nucleic acid-binding protein
MIFLDTSTLVDALTGRKHSEPDLRAAVVQGEQLYLTSLVIYEWFRGPRTAAEIADFERLFPSHRIIPFQTDDARLSAHFYRSLPRARVREMDLAIAAIAIRHDAPLWTLNPQDFRDIPRLRLFHPPR